MGQVCDVCSVLFPGTQSVNNGPRDPRWLTMCAVIRTVYITLLISITLLLACYFLGPLFTDWASGCYVRCGCIGSPVFSFPVDGVGGGLSTCSL